MRPLLLFSAFLIATCGLIYELVAGAVASYVLGDSITQFSLIIGLYLSAMGLGSWLSRFVERRLLARFVEIELAVGLVGGFSAALLFLTFDRLPGFRLLLFVLVALTGILVGLEIPLLIRILKGELELKELLSRVLSLDYAGALVASLAFPLILLPTMGLVRTSLLFGALNVAVGMAATVAFAHLEPALARLRALGAGALALLLVGFVGADALVSSAEAQLFADEVVFKASSPYQKLVLTRWRDDLRLYINANLQFSSVDEYRYHEALVHPTMALVPRPRRVLILGGGDGLAAREVLKYTTVEHITLVDLDPEMTRIFKDLPMLAQLNQGALADPKVTIVNEDAFVWLETARESFDVVVVDFPDPNNHSLGKLYTTTFYRLLQKALAAGGVMVVQASSPWYTPRSFWCVVATLEESGLHTLPYHAYVPSFGEWGYVLASPRPLAPPTRLTLSGLRFLSDASLPALFSFPPDLDRRPAPVNRLDNQELVRTYESEWHRVL